MSRLYIKHHTDNKHGTGHCGNEHVSMSIYYGSSKSSKEAIRVQLTYRKDEEYPRVHIVLGENVMVV